MTSYLARIESNTIRKLLWLAWYPIVFIDLLANIPARRWVKKDFWNTVHATFIMGWRGIV